MLAQAIATPRKKSATTLPKNNWNKSRLADSHEEKQPHFHGCPVVKAFSNELPRSKLWGIYRYLKSEIFRHSFKKPVAGRLVVSAQHEPQRNDLVDVEVRLRLTTGAA